MPEPTIYDWLARARAHDDARERQSALDAAEQLARDDSHWRAVAQTYREQAGDLEAARRCLLRAIEIEPVQAGCYGDLVRLLHDEQGDHAGARAVLAQGCDALENAPRVPVYMFHLLAKHCHHVGASDLVQRLLERGCQRAQSISDHCSMATGLASLLGQREQGLAELQWAEALAEELAEEPAVAENGRAEVRGFWGIANTYKNAFDDPEGARRSVERGLALATDVAGCVTMAQAWSSHATGDPTLTVSCLQQGERLATTARHWLELAEAYHEHLGDRDACRRCLERVAATDPSADESRQAAHGYRHWLDDAETADRLAPRGVPPAQLAPRKRPLEGWSDDADAGALLDWLRVQTTPEMLQTIAAADYGSGYADSLAALGDICETGLLPMPLSWQVHEVVALRRWSDGERVDHVERALVCTLLCLDYAHGEGYTEDIVSTLPALLESCLVLGEPALTRLSGLLVWLLETQVSDYEGADILAALHGLLLARAAVQPGDARLVALAARVLELERELSGDEIFAEPARGWLNRVLCGLRDQIWRHVTLSVLGPTLDEPAFSHLRAVRDAMRRDPAD